MSHGMIPNDLFRIQWVSEARIAPDGHTVAFTVTCLDEEADDYRAAIWVVTFQIICRTFFPIPSPITKS